MLKTFICSGKCSKLRTSIFGMSCEVQTNIRESKPADFCLRQGLRVFSINYFSSSPTGSFKNWALLSISSISKEEVREGARRLCSAYQGTEARGNLKFKSPVTRQFKSPLSRTNCASPKESYAELQLQVAAMKKILEKTGTEIHKLEHAGYRESELQSHIEKLHEYNEIKDVGQMVLGRIAVQEGVQSKDLYEKYGLKLSD